MIGRQQTACAQSLSRPLVVAGRGKSKQKLLDFEGVSYVEGLDSETKVVILCFRRWRTST